MSATAATGAAAGVHSVVVNNLATPGTIYSGAVSGGADASILPSGQNSGDFTLQIGGTGGTTADIPISGSNNTLATLASSINAASAQNKWGINATVVTDADGARLSIVSQTTGQSGALSVTNNTTSLNFGAPVGGTNASVTIDGTPYHYTSNTVPPGAIAGVTLNLASAAPNSTVQITVGPDVQSVTTAINTFVSAYNQVINDINTQFTVNPATDSEGPLGSDTALRSLQTSLMNDVTYSVSGNGGLVNLASLGINMNDDGTLTVGATPGGQTLDQVMTANPAAFQNFFQNASSTGFANNFQTDLNQLTDVTQGLLNVDLAQNKTQQQNLADDINNFQNQLTAEQTQLTAEYSQVNASLQAYPLLLQQVTETLGALGSGSTTSDTHPTLTSGL